MNINMKKPNVDILFSPNPSTYTDIGDDNNAKQNDQKMKTQDMP